jgi:hypothetical protein
MHGMQGVAIMSIKDGIKPLHRVSIDRIERELKDLRERLWDDVKRGRWVDIEDAIKDLDLIIELIESYNNDETHRCSTNWVDWCFEEV